METVRLIEVADGMEAEMICALLREHGVRCAYRQAGFQSVISPGAGMAGRQEVLVAQEDLKRAHEILAAPIDGGTA
jgi:hypothetical protein